MAIFSAQELGLNPSVESSSGLELLIGLEGTEQDDETSPGDPERRQRSPLMSPGSNGTPAPGLFRIFPPLKVHDQLKNKTENMTL